MMNEHLRDIEPTSARMAREKIEAESKRARVERNARGRKLLASKEFQGWLADVLLGMGYIGGFHGRYDDFNAGVMEAGRMLAASLGEEHAARVIEVTAARAVDLKEQAMRKGLK